MAYRILSGVKINESDRPGAVFYDSTSGRPCGPMFDSAEEAECFVSFLSGVDPTKLDWSIHHDYLAGEQLYRTWLAEGKPAKRKPFQFKESDVALDDFPEDQPPVWRFGSELMRECFPLFLGVKDECHGIEALMRKHKVLTKEDDTDTERGFFRVFFKTQAQGLAFLKRLNEWIAANWDKAYPEK